jgi:hypothetical protein
MATKRGTREMSEPTLTLHSGDLLSKWGFNDGDQPEPFLDWCDAQGEEYPEEFPWGELVRRFLVPALKQSVTVVDVETCHNPIRAESVDDTDVSRWWTHGHDSPYVLTPASVEVPMPEVLRIAREADDRS